MKKNAFSSLYLALEKRAGLRITLVVFGYLGLFTLLDKLALALQISPGIVAWYPPDGLSFAFLLVFGSRFWPLVALASLISSFFVFQFPFPPVALLGWTTLLTLALSLTAEFLRRIRVDGQLRSTRDILWLIFSTAIVSLILAVVSVSASIANGIILPGDRLSATFHWWIGEVTGIQTLTPLLLIHVMPWVNQFAKGEFQSQRRHFRLSLFQAIGQALAILIAIYLVFNVNWPLDFPPLYLVAIPLVWIVFRSGLSGVSLALFMINFGIALAVWIFPQADPAQLSQLQFQLLIVSVASLLNGSIIMENKQSEETSYPTATGEMKQRQKKIRRELLIILISALAIWVVEYTFDLYESITMWERQIGLKGIDETLMMAMFLGFAFAFFSYRRWKEVRIEMQERQKVEAELNALNRQLEQRVQERTAELSKANQSLQIEINERKQVEGTLRDSEKRFRALIENNADAITLVDASGVVIYDSPSAPGMLGYGPEEWINRSVFELLHPDDLSATLDIFRSVSETPGTRANATFRLRHKNGTWQWIEAVATNMLAEPSVKAVVVNYRDITERKRTEDELFISEDRYRDLVESSHDFICTHDLSGRLLSVNPQAERALGYSSGTLLNTDLRDYLTPNAKQNFDAYLSRIKEHGIAVGTMTVYTTSGEERIWEYRNTLRTEGVSEPVVRGVARDVTEQKQAEKEARSRTDELLTLYGLSRTLAGADELDEILTLINRHAVESIHTTFSRIALLEGDQFVARAAYPVRVLDHDLLIGEYKPIAELPYIRQVLDRDEPVILQASNADINSSEREFLLLDFVQTLCLMPLRIGGPALNSRQTIGLLILGEARNQEREPFTPGKIRLTQSIGDQAAVAIRRRLLHEQTERRLQQLAALRDIEQAIASSFDLQLSARVLLLHMTEQLGIDAAALWVFNPGTRMLEFKAGRGFRSRAFEQAKPLSLGEGYAGRAALERRMIHIGNLDTQQDNPRLMRALKGEMFASYYGVPLLAKGNVKGVLEVFHRTLLERDQDWLDFLNALAGQGAIAIDNTMLFESLQRSNDDLFMAYDKTLEGWSAALDLRDEETEGHTQRVTATTVQLAERMGFDEQELINVRRGALLHDIGKMGIPDRILLKPDKLTAEEWEIMRKHPIYAYDLISPIAYLRPALDIPYCHHEKWDGTGYPRGLKGEGIPLAARIFSIVDVWDALSSDRPYRDAWPQEKVLAYLKEQSGSHFDPEVVAVFMTMMDSKSE